LYLPFSFIIISYLIHRFSFCSGGRVVLVVVVGGGGGGSRVDDE